MSGFPTIEEVVATLRGQGLVAMAVAVERLQEAYVESRSFNQHNVAALNALRAKYEPQRTGQRDFTPPPEASD